MDQEIFSLECEQALLGGLMWGEDGLEKVAGLRPEHFHDPVHADLFAELKRRLEDGLPTDAVALKGWWVQAANRVQVCPDGLYTADLMRDAPSPESLKAYAQQVREFAERRALVRVSASLASKATDMEHSPKEALEAAERALAGLAETGSTGRRLVSVGMALRAGLRDVGRGTPSGWADFDRRFIGWKGGRYYVIAGRPGMGKSLFGAACAINRARAGEPVLFASLEMTAEDLAIRVAAAMSGVPYSTIERGEMSRDQETSLSRCMDEIDRLPMTIAGCPGASAATIRNMARRHDRDCKRQHGRGLGMLVVDYLGLLGSDGRNGRYEAVTENSIALKQTSLELEIPVLCLSQLSRKVEERNPKRPLMSDLRDSGGIEQDADAIFLLYREAYYAAQEEPPKDASQTYDWEQRCASRELDVDIAKQRGGPTGRVTLYCDVTTGEISDMDRRSVA